MGLDNGVLLVVICQRKKNADKKNLKYCVSITCFWFDTLVWNRLKRLEQRVEVYVDTKCIRTSRHWADHLRNKEWTSIHVWRWTTLRRKAKNVRRPSTIIIHFFPCTARCPVHQRLDRMYCRIAVGIRNAFTVRMYSQSKFCGHKTKTYSAERKRNNKWRCAPMEHYYLIDSVHRTRHTRRRGSHFAVKV